MKNELLQHLQDRIRAIEASERPNAASVPTPLLNGGLRSLFPEGLAGGTLVDLLSDGEGSGAWTLSLLMGKPLCLTGRIFVVADADRSFYPPAACGMGIDLDRLLIVRTPQRQHALTALVQSLRCPAVGAVVGSFDRMTSAEYRQLQVAAETGGGVGFMLRPIVALKTTSFAAVRLRVTHEPGGLHRRIRVEVIRGTDAVAGTSVIVEVEAGGEGVL